MIGSDAAAYGDRHAPVYDRIYGARFEDDGAVDALAAAAGGGRVLELGLGTGRIALPLVRRGVPVDGIEGSPAMAALLRSRPDGERVGVFVADLAGFDLPRHDYAVAVCAVSTLFMLPRGAQAGGVAAAARHLRPGGLLFIQAFRLDDARFGTDGRRLEERTVDGVVHLVRSRHDPLARTVEISHLLDADQEEYRVTLAYRAPEELDAIAVAAGLVPTGRWHDWSGAPARPDSRDPISVYRRP